jgi:hypothetical protein
MYLAGDSAEQYNHRLHAQLSLEMKLATGLSRTVVTSAGRSLALFGLSLVPNALRGIAASTRIPKQALLAPRLLPITEDKGPLGLDDPVVPEQHPQPGSEGARLGQRQPVSVELERTSMECVAKSDDELAAEDMAEHADGRKEGAPVRDPS